LALPVCVRLAQVLFELGYHTLHAERSFSDWILGQSSSGSLPPAFVSAPSAASSLPGSALGSPMPLARHPSHSFLRDSDRPPLLNAPTFASLVDRSHAELHQTGTPNGNKTASSTQSQHNAIAPEDSLVEFPEILASVGAFLRHQQQLKETLHGPEPYVPLLCASSAELSAAHAAIPAGSTAAAFRRALVHAAIQLSSASSTEPPTFTTASMATATPRANAATHNTTSNTSPSNAATTTLHHSTPTRAEKADSMWTMLDPNLVQLYVNEVRRCAATLIAPIVADLAVPPKPNTLPPPLFGVRAAASPAARISQAAKLSSSTVSQPQPRKPCATTPSRQPRRHSIASSAATPSSPKSSPSMAPKAGCGLAPSLGALPSGGVDVVSSDRPTPAGHPSTQSAHVTRHVPFLLLCCRVAATKLLEEKYPAYAASSLGQLRLRTLQGDFLRAFASPSLASIDILDLCPGHLTHSGVARARRASQPALAAVSELSPGLRSILLFERILSPDNPNSDPSAGSGARTRTEPGASAPSVHTFSPGSLAGRTGANWHGLASQIARPRRPQIPAISPERKPDTDTCGPSTPIVVRPRFVPPVV
jgi:hypothetical protein